MKKNYVVLLILLFSLWGSFGQCSPDTTPPTISCPANVTVTCQYDVPFISPTATDNCGFVVLQIWTLSGATTGSSPTSGINDASLELFEGGTTTVTYYIEDDSGNSATCNFTVTVNDSQEPLLICPVDLTVPNDTGLCSAVVNDFGFMSAWDNCSGITVNLEPGGLPPGSAFPVGKTTNTYTFTDAVGNSSACTFDITVTDEEDPIMTCPSNITAYTTLGQCNANVTIPLATATDNCSVSSITNDFNAGGSNASDSFPLGTTYITFIATDAAGNTDSCTMEVTVINSQSPVMTLLGSNPITLEACDVYTEPGATASDTCLGDISSSIVIDNSGLDTGAVGTYSVIYNVLGATPITRTVYVEDTTSPTLSLVGPNPLTIGDCATYTELGATALDACFGDISGSVVINNSTVNPGVLGSYVVTYDVTDASGNSASQITRTVNVIDVNLPEITLIGDNPQTIEACTPYVELGATAIDPCSSTDISSSLGIDTSAVNLNVPGTYAVTYNVSDSFGNDAIEVVRTINVVDASIVADAGADVANVTCTETTITLAGNAATGSSTGSWSVTSGQTNGFSFSDPTDPTATFIGDVGETYELTWSINNPCGISTDAINVIFMGCNALDFDGLDDNITFKNNYNFSGDFSIEVWVKSETTNGNTQTIISKRESNSQTDGYDLRIVNNYVSFNWNNGQSLASTYPITTNIWHHLAVTFGSGTYRLFIDGIEVNNTNGVVPASNAYDCILGAMDQTTNAPFKPLNYFDGGMDELRIWNVALSSDQIHKMMNQEIENNSGNVIGSFIPQLVAGLSWDDLLGYYQMNQSTDLSGGNLLSLGASLINGKLRYMTTLQPETAPLPYISNANGLWSNSTTWLFGDSQYAPNTIGVDGVTPIDWNIVQTSHNISSGNKNIVLLGLDVSNNILSIENTDASDGQSLRVTDYLIIDGTIDLVGESQLLQDTGSIVDYTGTGELYRDQQGTSNLYNYNYWGSPVSFNGTNFTIGGILYDGNQQVLWTTATNANPSTTPITMSSRWLYLYENFPISSYADWQSINENSSVPVGLGFLMKGSGAASSEQNYTFIGQPNNGTISTPITANYEALVGNPYPSAIDAHEFIYDNSSSILGTLYYWEHYITNNTHITAEYQGGFAAYNLTGGNAAISPPEISGLGTPSKIPERYIPVGQGFNVNGNATGGSVVFENDQRIFVKEAITGAADNGSVFMRQSNSKVQEATQSESEEDLIKRVRIDFTSPEGAIRHLLLGFVPNNQATDGFDYGYDALNTDNFSNDMFWMIGEERYIIQGVGDFDETKQYPLGVFLSTAGNIEIALVDLENFESEIEVYVHDALLDTYTEIEDFNSYNMNLDANNYLNRFFIAFMPGSALSISDQELENVTVSYLNETNEIYVKVPSTIEANEVQLLSILGQKINAWIISDAKVTQEFRIPVNSLSEGNYILKLKTNSGVINKKVLVKH